VSGKIFYDGGMGFAMADQIYIPLLDEGVDVWRPAPAWRIDPTRYILLRPPDYDPATETWAFPPGSVVEVSTRQIDQQPTLAAERLAPDSPAAEAG